MHQSRTRDVGMAVPKASIAVASVAKEHDAEVRSLGTFGTRQWDSATLIRKRPAKANPRVCVSAAGPCGAWLSRALTTKDAVCGVVAPACLPTQAGDWSTTDRRDARHRARLMRSGALPPVSGPAVADAAIRALRRAREETRRALQAATLRLTAC